MEEKPLGLGTIIKPDLTVATYLTDYLVATVGITCLYFILRIKFKIVQQNGHNTLAWIWDKEVMTSVTWMTYMVAIYDVTSAGATFYAGFVHQVLNNYDSSVTFNDLYYIIITWKFGIVFTVGSIFLLYWMADIYMEQEIGLKLPWILRMFYRSSTSIYCVYLLIYNMWHMYNAENPFNLKFIFVAYLSSCLLYIFCVTSVLIVKIFQRDVTSDIVLHTMAPWIMFIAVGISFVLRPVCSEEGSRYHENACPLPKQFNHNAVFHVIVTIGVALINVAEKRAVSKRFLRSKKKKS